MTPKRGIDFLFAGAIWGGFAFLLGARALGPSIWAGVLAAPFIGLAVGALIQPTFERHTGAARTFLSLASLYLSATLFGLAIGMAEWQRRGASPRAIAEELANGVLALWWGTTVTGYLLFLWPLAFGTHWLLEWRDEKDNGS